MNQRLVWNFELTQKKKDLPEKFPEQKSDPLKWEIRFFWPENQIVTLNKIDDSLLNLSRYQCKYREDLYYLLPDSHCNIKRRRDQFFYKPLLKQSNQAMGFGTKIKLDDLPKNSPAIEVAVKKEAFIYKFPTKPSIKLELARLEVCNKVYLSLCIEGKSLNIVESIAEHLLEKQVSCEYVSFLKNILPS